MKECMLLGESYISQVSVISLSTFWIRVQQSFYSGLMTPVDLHAVILEFLQHDVVVEMNCGKSQRVTHILALVEWYARHLQCKRYSKPVEVWANYSESLVPEHARYVLVGRFQSNCVLVRYQDPVLNHQYEKVNVIIPLLNSVRV